MKMLALLTLVLFAKVSDAEAHSCSPINTGGKTVVSYSNQVHGEEAEDEFYSTLNQAEAVRSLESIEGFTVVSLTTVYSDTTTESGNICKKFLRAKLSRVCNNILVDQSAYCSDRCEQSSWSEDCR